MKHPLNRRLYANWNRRRGTGPAFAGCEVALAELGAQLVHCFVVEFRGAGPARLRFCGSSLAMRYGRDLTDDDFLSLWRSPDRRTWAQALAQMRQTGAGIVADVTAETLGGGFATFELVLLPLSDGTVCDSAIGCMARTGGHEETNRIKAGIVAQSLDSHRCLSEPSAAKRASVEATRPARRPRLTVIDGSLAERPALTRS